MLFRGCVYSRELGGDTWLTVVTPRKYNKHKSYKVIYMLHGLTGNSSNWAENTMMSVYADEYDVMFIMPEVGNTWYRDIPNRGNYFSYIIDELPQIVGGIFNVSDKREDVAIMGNSMGGYGALKCALTKPEQYWLCGAFSSACVYMKEFLADEHNNEEKERLLLKGVFGEDLKCDEGDELIKLAKKVSQNPTKSILHLTMGKQDFLYESNQSFNEEMKILPLSYTYSTWDGDHNWYFWNESLKLILEKYYK